MNLDDQKLTGVGELVINDSLDAPLLELQVKRNSATVVPTSNDLIVYVDKENSTTPSENRREYIFNLSNVLQFNESSDVFKMNLVVKDNDIAMKTTVTRLDGTVEEVDTLLVCLFEGINYIYTNYSGADIEVIYPKNNDMNKYFLNNAIYANHKYKNKGDFSLDDIYFKDAFTKTENKLNLEVNNATVDCITSKNNKFSLDANGNLVVNSITSNNNPTFDILNAYPVGSIYLSVNDTNPSALFGGSWEAFGTGRCLVGVDSEQPEFITPEKVGGSKAHALTIDELPTHTHTISSSGAHKHTYTGYLQCEVSGASSYTAIAHKRYSSDGAATPPSMNSTGSHTHTVNETGSSLEHNNLQPYITCYMWKRVS